ncbi:centromere protein S-like [Sinocyclocheilus anshuiensis]|uniref:Centromere protein S n=1 Tax=Sinocyclocheilus anshuiensis TaxID=1608454 RepID=A0A671SCF5_9TELE|nr:PREDICTED: centromere protein S-like [Sinocyclocheilus anshuiensis]
MDEDETQKQRLKAAVHYTVGRLCQHIAADCEKQITKQTIAAIAETASRQCDIFAKDLEAFARHAKRHTVTVDDVKLTARRTTALYNYIQQKSEELALNNQELKRKRNAAKSKSKDMEAEENELED